MAAITMTVVERSIRPPLSPERLAELPGFSPTSGLDFLCGGCERVVLTRVVPKFALEHSFACPHCGALNEAP